MCVVRVHDLINENKEIRYIFKYQKRPKPRLVIAMCICWFEENESLVIFIINLTKLGIKSIYVWDLEIGHIIIETLSKYAMLKITKGYMRSMLFDIRLINEHENSG